jgi:hypothetical protein
VIVTEALAGGVTVAGLTAQVGVSVIVCGCAGATWQLKSTVLLNPFTVPTATCADDVPPGATASSDSGPACSVKLCAPANDGKARKTANRHKPATSAYRLLAPELDSGKWDCNKPDFNEKDLTKKDFANKDFNASDFRDSDGDDSDFNMSRFRFN